MVSNSKTAFSMDFLKKLEIKILLAKMSFKEKAEICNAVHGYHCGVDDSNVVDTSEGSR